MEERYESLNKMGIVVAIIEFVCPSLAKMPLLPHYLVLLLILNCKYDMSIAAVVFQSVSGSNR